MVCHLPPSSSAAGAETRRSEPPLRIVLQRWGLSPDDIMSVLYACPTLGGALSWQIGETIGEPPDLVIHLVDAGRLAGSGGATWNAMGPVHAMRQARQRGRTEIAVVAGGAALLPTVRAGCWLLAGERSLTEVLGLLMTCVTGALGAQEGRAAAFGRLASFDATGSVFNLHGDTPARAREELDNYLWALGQSALVAPAAVWLSSSVRIGDASDRGHGALPPGTTLEQHQHSPAAVPDGNGAAIYGISLFIWPDLLEPQPRPGSVSPGGR